MRDFLPPCPAWRVCVRMAVWVLLVGVVVAARDEDARGFVLVSARTAAEFGCCSLCISAEARLKDSGGPFYDLLVYNCMSSITCPTTDEDKCGYRTTPEGDRVLSATLCEKDGNGKITEVDKDGVATCEEKPCTVFDLTELAGEVTFIENLRPVFPLKDSCAEKRVGIGCGQCIDGYYGKERCGECKGMGPIIGVLVVVFLPPCLMSFYYFAWSSASSTKRT